MWIRRRSSHALVLSVALLATACGWFGAESAPTPVAATVAPTAVPPTDAPATPTVIVAQPVATATEAARDIDFAPLIAVIEQEMAMQQVPGLAVAVVHKGVPVFSQGFGLEEVANNTPVTPATLFRIGSITKPLTAIAILQLVEAGQVDLDASVVTYLPDFAVSDQITVRQLLSHSSGLGDAAIPYGRTDPAALQEYVATLNPASAFAPPGVLFSYSNVGYNILGRVIEVVSGMPYADFMGEQVFPALGMAHSTFRRDVALGEGLALGYYPSRGAPEPVDRDPDNGAEYPSGFAFSNVEDLSRLALFLLSDGMVEGEQRLLPASVQAMKTSVIRVEPLDVGYGLGLLIRTRSGETSVGHNGTINGYAATMELMPSQELAVIVLSNRNNYDPAHITQAAFDLFVAPTGNSPSQEIALDAVTLASYAGRYVMASALPGEEAEEVTVAVEGSGLMATMPGVTFDLRAVGTDLFDVYVPQVAEPVTQLAFLRDESGAIQYMSFTLHALMRVDE